MRRICLRILRKEGAAVGKEKDKTYGIIFDGAWLWEEYLNKILQPLEFTHSQNKLQSGGNPIYLFTNNTFSRYPDFFNRKLGVVIDAKYKSFSRTNYNETFRSDLHQLITYMHILGSTRGGFIYPDTGDSAVDNLGVLNGLGGEIFKYGLKIPSGQVSYKDFVYQMTIAEGAMEKAILHLSGR